MTRDQHDVVMGWSINLGLAAGEMAEVKTWIVKIISVFVLACVAELGRRLIGKLWRDKK